EQQAEKSHIHQQPAPISIIPKSFATESLLANIILGKYQYAMPLYQALKTHLLEQVVVQADETPFNVLKEDKQCYMWLYCSGADSPEAKLPDMKNIVLFDYQNSRA
ncbi:IS66 family transposase, partial [Vibrio sp. S12_S33]|uniref:IS66 family transposase n=1 Tax=Vibrio sp. S12_S33 TaxID=2720223 RepID=UPI001781C1D7